VILLASWVLEREGGLQGNGEFRRGARPPPETSELSLAAKHTGHAPFHLRMFDEFTAVQLRDSTIERVVFRSFAFRAPTDRLDQKLADALAFVAGGIEDYGLLFGSEFDCHILTLCWIVFRVNGRSNDRRRGAANCDLRLKRSERRWGGHAFSGFFDCGSCDGAASTFAQNDDFFEGVRDDRGLRLLQGGFAGNYFDLGS